MPLVTNAYCSLLAVQKETGNSESELDEWFEECIVAASRWIDDYCYRDFLPHDHTSTAYTVKSSELVADYIYLDWPINTLTEVKSGDLVIASDLYEWNAGKRFIRLLDGSHWLAKNQPRANQLGYGMGFEIARVGYALPITLKGSFGYTTPPQAVQIACTNIAAAWSHEKRREKVSYDGTRHSLLDERIPEDAKDLLKRFRKLVN